MWVFTVLELAFRKEMALMLIVVEKIPWLNIVNLNEVDSANSEASIGNPVAKVVNC